MKKYYDFISEAKIIYHKELCQDVWNDKALKPKIGDKLLKIARDFFTDCEFDTEILDIELVGSMVNFNFTSSSDIDVHIIIDFADLKEDVELVKKAVDGQRFMWNLRHNIVIHDHDVEMYIQDKNEEHISAGCYSLMNRKWIKIPVYSPPDVDTKEIDPKYDSRVYDIDELERLSKQDLDPVDSESYYKKAKELKLKIMKARKAGLSEGGEFSIENLVFKKLRNEGYIEKLIETITAFYDKIYSQ